MSDTPFDDIEPFIYAEMMKDDFRDDLVDMNDDTSCMSAPDDWIEPTVKGRQLSYFEKLVEASLNKRFAKKKNQAI